MSDWALFFILQQYERKLYELFDDDEEYRAFIKETAKSAIEQEVENAIRAAIKRREKRERENE